MMNPFAPENQVTYVDVQALYDQIAALQAENNFLRGLVEENSREKAFLLTTIEGLQHEVKGDFPISLICSTSLCPQI